MPHKAALSSFIFPAACAHSSSCQGASSREIAVELQTLVWPSCITSWWNDSTGAHGGRAPLAQRSCWLKWPPRLPQGAASGLWVLTLAALSPAVGVPARGLARGHRPDPAAGWGHHPPGGRPGLARHRALCQRPAAGTALHPSAAAHGCCGAAGMQVRLSCPSHGSCGPVICPARVPVASFVELTPVSLSVPMCPSLVLRWLACTLPAFQTSWTATRSQWKSQSQ